MTEKRHNKKAPKSKVCDKKVEPKWYYTHVDRKKTGGHTMCYDDPENHKKYYHEELHSSCSYKVTEADDDDKEINHNLNVGELRNYTGGGVSNHSDSHTDFNSEGTFRNESSGDSGHVSGRNYLRGTKGHEIKVKSNEHHSTAKSSEGISDFSTSGTRREKYKKDYFVHGEGDRVYMGEKNDVSVIQKDSSLYVGQNWDNYIKEKGKIETGDVFKVVSGGTTSVNSAAKFETTSKEDTSIKSDAKVSITGKNEISLTDDTKIVLTVGQSKITIESGKISIEGTQIEIKGTGSTSIDGHPVKINGGGTTTPPFQVS